MGTVNTRITGERTWLGGKSLEEHRLAALHSLLNARGTESLSLVSKSAMALKDLELTLKNNFFGSVKVRIFSN